VGVDCVVGACVGNGVDCGGGAIEDVGVVVDDVGAGGSGAGECVGFWVGSSVLRFVGSRLDVGVVSLVDVVVVNGCVIAGGASGVSGSIWGGVGTVGSGDVGVEVGVIIVRFIWPGACPSASGVLVSNGGSTVVGVVVF
jgi:hypothetical protein